MIKKQAGQALILVLIVLAIGSMLVIPSLRLTGTSLMNTPIVERQIKGLYAADAAQEYILWKLAYDNLGQQFTVDGQSASFNFNVCDVPVNTTIVMRATEGQGGMVLATDHKIKPTKEVDPNEVDNDYSGPYTYTMSNDTMTYMWMGFMEVQQECKMDGDNLVITTATPYYNEDGTEIIAVAITLSTYKPYEGTIPESAWPTTVCPAVW